MTNLDKWRRGGIRTPGTVFDRTDGLATNGRPFRVGDCLFGPVLVTAGCSANRPNSWWQFGGNFSSHLRQMYTAPCVILRKLRIVG